MESLTSIISTTWAYRKVILLLLKWTAPRQLHHPLASWVISLCLQIAQLLDHNHSLRTWLHLAISSSNEAWVWLFYRFLLWSLFYHLSFYLSALDFWAINYDQYYPTSCKPELWSVILSPTSFASTFTKTCSSSLWLSTDQFFPFSLLLSRLSLLPAQSLPGKTRKFPLLDLE